ncbi:MAG: zinc ABC transporter substrate-binding protein [Verrucomicrobia bacterium]|nr:zinc ABC transporter substrate-binding protein [Verrucomicrobiota bacterium]
MLALALLPLLAFSASTRAAEPATKLRVLTSFLPVYCFTANVAGDHAEVENLLPANVGPHDYQFAPRDLRKLSGAQLFIVNGHGMEDWLAKAMKAAKGSQPPTVIEAYAGVPKARLITELPHIHLPGEHGHHHHDGPNPHLWLDPTLAAHAVTNILAALQKADPKNAAGYAANAARYVERLHALDRDLAAALAPAKGRRIVTYHHAFPYFTRRYGLDLIGVIEEVPDNEPSAKYLAALLKVMREKDVRVIFTEPQFSPKLAQRISRDAKVPVAELDTLETGPLKPTAYEEGLRRNLNTLLRHLK